MAQLIPVEHDPFADEAGTSQQGLPRAGDATPAAGAVQPGALTFPGYSTADDEEMRLRSMAFPRGSSVDLKSPGHEYAETYAKDIAHHNAQLTIKQTAGKKFIPGLQQAREMIQRASDEDWSKAAGPLNSMPNAPRWEAPLNPKAWWAEPQTPTQARAAYNPSVATNRQWDLQNSLHNLVGDLTDQFMSANAGGQQSDARVGIFKEMIGDLLKSTSRAEALKLLSRAEETARGVYGLPSYYDHARDAISRGADPEAVAKRLQENGFDHQKLFER